MGVGCTRIMVGKTLLQVDPKEKETGPRVVERLAPVASEPLDASAAPQTRTSMWVRLMLVFYGLQPNACWM